MLYYIYFCFRQIRERVAEIMSFYAPFVILDAMSVSIFVISYKTFFKRLQKYIQSKVDLKNPHTPEAFEMRTVSL